ncbi:unnamed protein product [Cylicocyclus nassatus]|uniref:Uncharacterized protein n=1 Tax=Cylicocyclus nassatus TaxID=53992 RepID=A0AA36GM37_CYLNA|nr:unnamed protein product [Cylicocyclus nassatus]
MILTKFASNCSPNNFNWKEDYTHFHVANLIRRIKIQEKGYYVTNGSRLRGQLAQTIVMSEKKESYQDSVNKKVLLEWVTVTGLENPRKKPYDRILNDFAVKVLKYPVEKPMAFTWPTSAGMSNNIQAIRAKVSFEFRKYFISEGRNLLLEYNKQNNNDVCISHEQTLKVSETERLGKYIRDVHVQSKRKCPEMTFKKGVLQIGKEYSLTPPMAAIKIIINMSAWTGLPLKELLLPAKKNQWRKNLDEPTTSKESDEIQEACKRPSEEPNLDEAVTKPKVQGLMYVP